MQSDAARRQKRLTIKRSSWHGLGSSYIRGVILHFADEPLHGLAAPEPHAPLQRMEIAQAVTSGVARLELDEQLERGLIRMGLKMLQHFSPVRLERTATTTARIVGEASLLSPPDEHASIPCIVAPDRDVPSEPLVLPASEATGELRAQFLEQLQAIDVREPFEATTDDWPNHRERGDFGFPRLGIGHFRSLLQWFPRLRRRRRRIAQESHRLRWRERIGPSDSRRAAPIAHLGFDIERRTNFANPRGAREAREERREIGSRGRGRAWLIAVGQGYQVRWCHRESNNPQI
jgi:hypothetical protein